MISRMRTSGAGAGRVCKARVSLHRISGKNKIQPEEIRVPTVHADYAFFAEMKATTDEEDLAEWAADLDKIKILTVKDGQSRRIRAHQVPKKGVRDQPWVAATVAEDMSIWGHTTAIFRTDQERKVDEVDTC